MLEKLYNVMPPPMCAYLMTLNIKEKTGFLLSGLGSEFVFEWMDVYECIVRFTERLYNERRQIMETNSMQLY